MSRVEKAICDKCKREMELDEWFCSARITEMSMGSSIGRYIAKGDYCKKCFTETIKEELGI